MPETTDGVAWRRSNSVAWVDASHRSVLLPLQSATRPLILDGSAAVVWQQLGPGIRFDELVVRVAEQFAVDPETISTDVAGLLRELMAHGLVEAG